jgi:hypothetical protein
MTESNAGSTIQVTPAATSTGSPVTSNDRDLTGEVVALREAFDTKMDRFTLAVTNLTQLLRDKQKEAERQIQESQSAGKVAAKLLASDLPNSSRVRLAENYTAGQDLDTAIERENEYLKSVLSESHSGSMEKTRESGTLGLSESAMVTRHRSTNDEFGAVEAVLRGEY